MTASGKPQNKKQSVPTINIQLTSKFINFEFSLTLPVIQQQWILALLGAIILWYFQGFSSLIDFIRTFISLVGK